MNSHNRATGGGGRVFEATCVSFCFELEATTAGATRVEEGAAVRGVVSPGGAGGVLVCRERDAGDCATEELGRAPGEVAELMIASCGATGEGGRLVGKVLAAGGGTVGVELVLMALRAPGGAAAAT